MAHRQILVDLGCHIGVRRLSVRHRWAMEGRDSLVLGIYPVKYLAEDFVNKEGYESDRSSPLLPQIRGRLQGYPRDHVSRSIN